MERNFKYKKPPSRALQVEEETEPQHVIKYFTDSNMKWDIPFSENNIDYQEYLVWVAEGNTAEPADE